MSGMRWRRWATGWPAAMRWTAAMAAVAMMVGVAAQTAADDLQRRASWSALSAAEVRAQLEQWLTRQNASPEQQARARAHWTNEAFATNGDPLEAFAAAAAELNPAIAALWKGCHDDAGLLPDQVTAFLLDEATAPFSRDNLRVYYGRWLAQRGYQDEALQFLSGLQPNDVLDPAGLLFYRAVAQHHLLDKPGCLESLTKLLDNEAAVPKRYLVIARLMDADIRPLEADSLDEVSRLMDDIRRRLSFGRAGQRVRREEDDVIAKLDKMIEEMEKKAQEMQQQAGAGGGTLQPTKPAEDSAALGGSGPGDVGSKTLENKSAWGDLPPKERQEALQQISKDLPSHYRDVIEEYFRKLAQEQP